MAEWARTTKLFLLGGGVIYLIPWIYGLVIDQDGAATFVPVNTADTWLHLALGVGMLGVGLLAGRARRRLRWRSPSVAPPHRRGRQNLDQVNGEIVLGSEHRGAVHSHAPGRRRRGPSQSAHDSMVPAAAGDHQRRLMLSLPAVCACARVARSSIGSGFDDAGGDRRPWGVGVRGQSGEHLECTISGDVEAFHQPALGLTDDVPACERGPELSFVRPAVIAMAAGQRAPPRWIRIRCRRCSVRRRTGSRSPEWSARV